MKLDKEDPVAAVELLTDALATALVEQQLYSLRDVTDRIRKVTGGEEEPLCDYVGVRVDYPDG